MAEKVAKVGIKKQKDELYFVNKEGDTSRAKMAGSGKRKDKFLLTIWYSDNLNRRGSKVVKCT